MAKYDMTEVEHAYQSIQLAMSAVVDATKRKSYLCINEREATSRMIWKGIVERTYMLGWQAALVASQCGDEKTSNYTYNLCNTLVKLSEEV